MGFDRPLRPHTLGTLALLLATALALSACSGEHMGPGEVTAGTRPADEVRERTATQRKTAANLAAGDTQILFGDLHVHTSFSPDALTISMPVMQGEGVRPPADACDFARFCSALDFWSINDHAEGITPQRWRETIDSIRQCNAVTGPGPDPDLVSFVGWEWSQVSVRPESHYGHKNVVLLGLEDDELPRRPIAAPRENLGRAPMGLFARLALAATDRENASFYLDYGRYYDELAETPVCAKGVDTRELPAECLETADDPRELFEKLDQWGHRSIVIPHGNAWGLTTPAGVSFDKQLAVGMHDPDRQRLIEVFSGHGNSEELRPWRGVEHAPDGSRVCQAPTPEYEPCCWRAGEIIRGRCEDPSSEECEARVAAARQNHIDAGPAGFRTVPGAQLEDWLGCGQCPDCFLPAFDYRPGTSTQYALAIGGFDGPEGDASAQTTSDPRRFRFGLIGSSDIHRSRPGTGYKEFGRFRMTDVAVPRSNVGPAAMTDDRDPDPESIRYEDPAKELPLSQLRHMERQASFFMTGGLAAVHASGRDRSSIFEALERREVYATSGDRILLWFDLLRADGSLPMGSEIALDEAPRFRVRAAGAFVQKPGCSDSSLQGLGSERVASLCQGECYHPGERRKRIDRIEVVRIRPQQHPGEDPSTLVEDPWRVLPCNDQGSGCIAEFSDPEFPGAPRESVYYVRAIQEPSLAVNAGGLRCERDDEGNCIRVKPCYGDDRTRSEDDCLAEIEERAWSSPIFVDPAS